MNGTLSGTGRLIGILTPIQQIIGELTNAAIPITGILAETQTLVGSLTKTNLQVEGTVMIPVKRDEEIDVYTGEYEVTPMPFDNQTLQTMNLKMLHDVFIHKIPYYETGNESGYTVYIGGD